MDNPFFPLHHKHLRGCKPCAPNPVGAVTPAGTKRAHRLFLWISQHLCQKYPQFYAAPRRQRLFSAKTQASALPASAISSFFNSKTSYCRKKKGLHLPAFAQVRACKPTPCAGQSSLFSTPRTPPRHFSGIHNPARFASRRLIGCSLKALY